MSYIKISAKGKDLLKRKDAASAVSFAIAAQQSDISSEKGVVVKSGGVTFTVKSAARSAIENIAS